jgi:hypothetical protein
MQRQRQELSQAVRELTDSSNTIYKEMSRNVSGIKKRSSLTLWTETDLDTFQYGKLNDSLNDSISPHMLDNMSNSLNSNNIINCSSSSKIEDYENRMLDERINLYNHEHAENEDLETIAFGNFSQQERPEIKTVRIVKRESERRQRDRERSGIFSAQNLDQVMEEEAQILNKVINNDNYLHQKFKPYANLETHEAFNQLPLQYQPQSKYGDYYNSLNFQNNGYPISVIDRVADLYSDLSSPQTSGNEKKYVNYFQPNDNLNKKAESIQSLSKALGELSPVFQSEAARQIIIEMSNSDNSNANKQRRVVPKEKRRHFTAPHHVNAKTVQSLQSENQALNNVRSMNSLISAPIVIIFIYF